MQLSAIYSMYVVNWTYCHSAIYLQAKNHSAKNMNVDVNNASNLQREKVVSSFHINQMIVQQRYVSSETSVCIADRTNCFSTTNSSAKINVIIIIIIIITEKLYFIVKR